MMYVIRDEDTGHYYARRFTKTGWYSPEKGEARLYKSAEAAHRTIEMGNHHVTYPGNRTLIIDTLSLT
jgi:hypothetical protein